MKKIKLISIIVALLMVCVSFASCAEKSTTVSVNCTISIIVDDEYVLDHYEYTVEGTEEEPPTVLQAAYEALQVNKIPFTIDSDANSFVTITYDGVDYSAGRSEDSTYVAGWLYTANGEEPETGRAGTNLILEGQDIVFTFVKEYIAR